jgi:hypothetical protein
VPDHVLLSGPPGLGKTTLAMIIASEMNAPLRISSGPAIQHAGDLAAILSGLMEGEVFFLDEIHRMSRPAEEMLYLAMEDFRVDVIVGKGPGATAIPSIFRASPLLVPRPGRASCRARCVIGSASLRSSISTMPPTWSTSCTAPPSCSPFQWIQLVLPRSLGALAARRESQIGCSAGSATTPRFGRTGG